MYIVYCIFLSFKHHARCFYHPLAGVAKNKQNTMFYFFHISGSRRGHWSIRFSITHHIIHTSLFTSFIVFIQSQVTAVTWTLFTTLRLTMQWKCCMYYMLLCIIVIFYYIQTEEWTYYTYMNTYSHNYCIRTIEKSGWKILNCQNK